MPVTEIGDPRLQALFGAHDPRDAGVRPVVGLPRKGVPPIFLAAGLTLFAVLLFMILNGRRLAQSEPGAESQATARGVTEWQAPPPLYIPAIPAPPMESDLSARSRSVSLPVPTPAPTPLTHVQPQVVYSPPQPVAQIAAPVPAPQPRVSAGAPLVIDTGGSAAGVAGAGASPLTPGGQTVARVRASALANRSVTVPQGYLIPAVLETGFNSTQPGFARAIVSREVRSFDGTHVLIPRGSRLIGEYRSDVAQGQKRAVIVWTRLIRPDGMTIALDSPAVDTLGRGGVPASVNTHFWQRLGDALLQTTVGIGTALAQRQISGPVIVLPGNGASVGAQIAPVKDYVPTLTVPAGKSISVFVAHDLDFSAAGPPR